MQAGPSSWDFTGVPVTHKCDLCLEHMTEAPIQLNQSNSICKDCFVSDLRPKFEAALQNEQFWPVTFGTVLHPGWFPAFFTNQFVADYAEKEKEYITPVGSRFYCAASPCGKFLGGADGDSVLVCTCGSKTCKHCRTLIESDTTHTCTTTETEADPFEGLRLGRDYQRCPRCQILIQLSEACNHVICRCGEELCVVCGMPARGNSTHWQPGGCPRYNHPETNPQYDTVDRVHHGPLGGITDDPWNDFETFVNDIRHLDEPFESFQPDPATVGMPALLSQALDALEVGRPQAQQPAPLRDTQPEQDIATARRREFQNDVRRRAANDIAARMGFLPGPAPPRGRR